MKRGKLMLIVLEEIARTSRNRMEGSVKPLASRRYSCTGVIDTSLSLEQKEFRRLQMLKSEQKLKEEFRRLDKCRRQKEINRLIKEGFIEKNGHSLTDKGEEKRGWLKQRFLKFSLLDNAVKKIKEGDIIIVSFDIPEKHRAIRDWIRGVLKFLDYEMIHKSVWCGKVKLPEDFFNFLHSIDVDQYVKVFTVSHKGNLKIKK